MDFVLVNSLNELEELAGKNDFLLALLYKTKSDASNCAMETLENAFEDENSNICLALVDVEQTRDIHGVFGVETVPSVVVFKKGQFVNVVKGCMSSNFYRALAEEQGPGYRSIDQGKKTPQVTVYTTSTCSWCTTLKDHLNRNNIRFREINISTSPAMAEEMKRKSGQMGVPQTDIDGQMIVGFDKAKIDRLLGIVGN
jgi:glutaredoxin-like YruB-family protein